MLRSFFNSIENMTDVRIAREGDKSRGFGHVEFSNKTGVEKALLKSG